MSSERKKILLRLDPAVHDALARWAGDELRSTNAQIEFLLRRALADAGRMPGSVGRMRRRGRPRKADEPDTGPDGGPDGGAGPAGPAATDDQTRPDQGPDTGTEKDPPLGGSED
ncbi:hypothetical protein [Actinomadura sp. WMMB 499]|uniref:hypothetical protein n=1 Tax=Actinomadura sp. WMMB 499 TaxID=1219491 RepID=UPI001247E7C9|nr:hypothetical protein [Actinomadura sp. WMMB 499]QFG20520.1 hypothetical protein F7P10_04430 [Actinomadura sp. WMMB 499]